MPAGVLVGDHRRREGGENPPRTRRCDGLLIAGQFLATAAGLITAAGRPARASVAIAGDWQLQSGNCLPSSPEPEDLPGGPAGEPKPAFALLGAIVETGPASGWFFKLTGPEKTLDAAKGDFDRMVDSLRAK